MKAQERFNARSAPWIEVQRPNLASGLADGILVAFEGRDTETNNPRVLHISMSPLEALDFAARLVRATLKTKADTLAPELVCTGQMLLQSQQVFLQPMLATAGDSAGQRMLQKELDRITEELENGRFLMD
jgi:hypothetical protein